MRTSALCAVAGLAAVSLSLTGCSSGSKSAAGTPAAAVSSAAAAAKSGATAAAAAAATGSSGSGAGAGSGSVNVCALLSSAQASSINHVTYGATTPKAVAAGYDQCTYKNTGKHESPIDIQDLNVAVLSIPGCWSQLQSADGPGTSVSGVGDAAFGASIGLDIKVGDRCVTITGLTDAELMGHYDRDIAMAKIILGGLH